MSEKSTDTNMVKLVGMLKEEKEYSHEIYGEKFYRIIVEVPRLSEAVDLLPITISERLLINLDLKVGNYVIIEGQLRSYNRYIAATNKLVLTIFAREIYIPDEEELQETLKTPNEIYLDGYICKKPVYRVTPFGREIADLLIAVNRAYSKSDYIPSIGWGRNARFCENLIVGDHIKLWGRIQSRQYNKKLEFGDVETRVAYEVSISKLEFIEDGNNRVDLEEKEG